MKKQFSIFFLIVSAAFFYSAIAILLGGCAQIGMPIGGPKDSLPPVLAQASPPNHSLNFKGNRITLTFNEYIQLDNPLQNVIVAPLPKMTPFIDFKLKTVTVKLYDTLKPNTTYSIQFGKSIRDLNENNPLSGFDYVFSTGAYIDSMQVAGSVALAESGTIDTTLTVLLYKDLGDSAVYKHKPDYISRLNKDGEFRFKNLAPGRYAVFAIKDESGQYLYNNPTQLFAFADSAVQSSPHSEKNVQLFAYRQEEPLPKSAAAKPEGELNYTVSVKTAPQGLLDPLEISVNHDIQSVDTSSVFLTDTLLHRLPGQSLSIDSSRKKIFIQLPWTGSTDYDLVILKNGITDSLGKSNVQSDTLRFKTKNESDYGSLKLTFKNLSKFKNPVLQLVNEKGEVSSFQLAGNVFDKKLVPPGTYHIQILEDLNRNGKWDPGNYSERLQPEMVHRVQQSVSIRANWDNERDIIL